MLLTDSHLGYWGNPRANISALKKSAYFTRRCSPSKTDLILITFVRYSIRMQDNILLDGSGEALLCDFGLSRIRHEVTRTHTTIPEGGRNRFLAPELSAAITTRFRTSPSSDIYSLSMTFLNIWTREPPFAKTSNEYKVASWMRDGHRPRRPPVSLNLSSDIEEQFWELVQRMWAHEPNLRPPSSTVQKRLEEIFRTNLVTR